LYSDHGKKKEHLLNETQKSILTLLPKKGTEHAEGCLGLLVGWGRGDIGT